MASLPLIEDFDDPDYDPFLAEEGVFGTMTDMHARLRKLREGGAIVPGHFMQHMGLDWPTFGETHTVLGFREVAQSLTDYKTFTNACFKKTLGMTFGRTLSAMDPPDHPLYRRLFQKAFLPQNIARWGSEIVDVVVHELIDRFRHRGEADLIDEFTKLYPFEIIYRQLALPEADGPIFHRLSAAQNMTYTAQGREAAAKLGAYFDALVAERRRHPGDDLASALITAEVDGEQLPEDVVVSFLRQLINAAGDTTFRGTSIFLTGLLTNPDQYAALRDDRTLMPHAIEEALRWESPVNWTERTVAVDTTLGGVALPAGALLAVVLGAANIDEAVYDEGERFDIFRQWSSADAPIIFARGPHICLGQHLARLEITRAMTAILDHFPNLRLDPDKPGPEVQGALLRYPKHLHVRFD